MAHDGGAQKSYPKHIELFFAIHFQFFISLLNYSARQKRKKLKAYYELRQWRDEFRVVAVVGGGTIVYGLSSVKRMDGRKIFEAISRLFIVVRVF